MTVLQRIDPHGCGCDAPEQLARLIGIDEALDRIARNAAPVSGTEALPLMRAPGRVLAEPVRAAAMTPPFDNAAMDGYAVDTADFVGGGPWRFAVAARIPAGASCTGPVGQARVARIFTGAPLPAGADAVIRQEDACRVNGEVTFENRPARWSNSCRSAMPEETQMHLAYTMAPDRNALARWAMVVVRAAAEAI